MREMKDTGTKADSHCGQSPGPLWEEGCLPCVPHQHGEKVLLLVTEILRECEVYPSPSNQTASGDHKPLGCLEFSPCITDILNRASTKARGVTTPVPTCAFIFSGVAAAPSTAPPTVLCCIASWPGERIHGTTEVTPRHRQAEALGCQEHAWLQQFHGLFVGRDAKPP